MSAPYVDVHAAMVAAGVPIDNHESDLYALASPEAIAIVRGAGWSHTFFTSRVDGRRWLDIPFAFTPWWDRRSQS